MTTALPLPSLVPALSLPPRTSEISAARTAARRLPLPTVIAARLGPTVYGCTTVDNCGRLADRTVMAALGWRPGTAISVRVTDGPVTVTAVADGRHTVSGQGRVHLPAHIRHAAGIRTGDRVLLAAAPDDGRLVVYPLARLDAMLGAPPVRADGAA